ncbi:MAG: flavin reductase family protein [Phycisphaerae bacterium]
MSEGTVVRKDAETIGAALGCIPSGCSVLTVEHDGTTTGLLVSWVQQASFEPPALTVCIKHGRPVESLIDASHRFLLNVLGEGSKEMLHHFGKGFSLTADAFVGLDTRTSEFGPVIESCVAHLGCRVLSKVPTGDHSLYVAEVVAGGVVDGARPYTHIRKSGLSY